MRAIIAYILLIAFRDRLFHGMVLGMAALGYISMVLGHTALAEAEQTGITLAAGSIRLLIMIGIMVLVSFHVHQAREARELDGQLARPIARHHVVVAYFTAFAIAALVLCTIAGMVLASLSPLHWYGFGGFMLSLFLESLVVIALSMFTAFALRSAVLSVMAALSFYALARLMGFFIITLINSPTSGAWLSYSTANFIVKAVALVTPRLDFFAKTQWLHYGLSNQDYVLFIAQASIFVPLLLCAVILDLRRKVF